MLEECQHHFLMDNMTQRVLPRLLPKLTDAGKVTILLFTITCCGAVHAKDDNGIDLNILEFTSEFYMPMGRGCLDGLMASDGSNHRIAIYWIEPVMLRENTSFLCYGDFIFAPEAVYYWIHGDLQLGTFHLSENPIDPLLPRRDSVESVVRSALAILSRIRCQHENPDISLEVARFFQQSRGQTEYAYKVLPDETDNNDISIGTASDVHILNTLPYGRQYTKEKRSDGSIAWSARRALNGQPVASLTIKPAKGVDKNLCLDVFDTQTLGKWKLIPDSYKAYWSFEREYSELNTSADESISSLELYDKVESYLDNNKMPDKVCRALNRLRFKIAMRTDDTSRLSQSAQVVVTRLCLDDSVSKYEWFLELAWIDEQIRKQYPKQTDEMLQPLVRQVVKYAGHDAVSSFNKLMPTINANKWFMYGKLLLTEIRSQDLAEKEIVKNMAARLEASRLARERQAPDPCEFTPSVKQYLSQLDANPPRGSIDMNDIRYILDTGLAKHYTDGNSETKRKIVEDVIRSIRLIVGDGPFCGNQAQLIESIERFSRIYLKVEQIKEPIDTVLATFLALSFCDISTPEDHDLLFSQFDRRCVELQTQVNTMLGDRGLSSLVTTEDLKGVFNMYKRIFRRYIDDPIWPAFKFPLTANEQDILASKLKLRFMQLDSFFDEMSDKLKYGGTSTELKEKTVFEISSAAQQLLPDTAFLRSPPYPGVSSRYRGKYGFTAVIKGPLYEDGKRPKEKFKAMKYFHLGHRLEEIVKRESQLARAS
jgi:hypothetical protein